MEEDADFGTAEPAAPEDPGLTSGVSTLSSVLSHESQRQNQPHPLGMQLGRMKQETNRCGGVRAPSLDVSEMILFLAVLCSAFKYILQIK